MIQYFHLLMKVYCTVYSKVPSSMTVSHLGLRPPGSPGPTWCFAHFWCFQIVIHNLPCMFLTCAILNIRYSNLTVSDTVNYAYAINSALKKTKAVFINTCICSKVVNLVYNIVLLDTRYNISDCKLHILVSSVDGYYFFESFKNISC